MIYTKQCSSLDKILPLTECGAGSIGSLSTLQGEQLSYQIAFKTDSKCPLTVTIESVIKEKIKPYLIGTVPVMMPTYPQAFEDDNYISHEPGIFPDPMYPLTKDTVMSNSWYQALWFTVDCSVPSGNYEITVTLSDGENTAVNHFYIEVLPVRLPEQELIFTQWFHADCISSHYRVDAWSEKHWELVERFVKMAADFGINMLLTPIFTPPLDTDVGGERPTVQLVGIEMDGNTYSFDFSLLKRWFDMCRKNGIKYFEMAHLFTQWGAEFTPKIIVVENGEEKRIFGWDVGACDESYSVFLSQFLPALTAFIESEGLKEVTYFHISDEPYEKYLESYRRAKEMVMKYLDGFTVIDALSDYDFYKKGVVEHPVVSINHI